jgi:opacity protein-like surface antigen
LHKFLTSLFFIATTSLNATPRPSLTRPLTPNTWHSLCWGIGLGGSYVNLNYSGETSKKISLISGYFISPYMNGISTEIAKNISSGGAYFDCFIGYGFEINESTGILLKGNINLGVTQPIIDDRSAQFSDLDLMVGPYFCTPNFRISLLGGVGFGVSFFGYPNAIDKLISQQTVYETSEKNWISRKFSAFSKLSVGLDYKINRTMYLGLQYAYAHGLSSYTFNDNTTIKVTAHLFGLSLGFTEN